MRPRAMNQAGFSVVELIAVMAISSITLTMALELAPTAKRDSETERAAEQLVADVRLARMRAISTQEPTAVSIFPEDRRYVITPGGIDRTLPKGMSIADPAVPTGPPTPIEFEFEARGLLTDPSPVHLQVKGHNQTFQIDVSPGGQVRMGGGAEPGK